MKVIHQSPSQLVLEDSPWLTGLLMILTALIFAGGSMALIGSGEVFGGIIVILVGVGVPVLIGALIVQRLRLTFDRATGQITRTRRSVLGLTQKSYAFDRLDRAYVDVSSDSDGTTYRMELRLQDPDETVPSTTYYTTGKKPERMAEAVNAWLGRDA